MMALLIAMDDDGGGHVCLYSKKPCKEYYSGRSGDYYYTCPRDYTLALRSSVARKLNMRPGDCKRVKIVEDTE